ncbi:ufm1-specific protease 1-like [Styela clava]
MSMSPVKSTKFPDELPHDIHRDLLNESLENCKVEAVKGTYAYYHYLCDGVDDRGWGCGYRTLQTMCSWIHYHKQKNRTKSKNETTNNDKIYDKITGHVPSISEVQHALVSMGDKEHSFMGSKEWIGSFEISICIDYVYDVPCRIVHVPQGQLVNHIQSINEHFQKYGSPIMMGGDNDNSSKGIFGIARCNQENCIYLIIIDPHCTFIDSDPNFLVKNKWVDWRRIDDFDNYSFYNLCFPLLSS